MKKLPRYSGFTSKPSKKPASYRQQADTSVVEVVVVVGVVVAGFRKIKH
jgi:hypothetical protein